MRVAIACGGTGGHLFPGLATAMALRKRGHTVALWISGRDVEAHVLKVWDGEVVAVRASASSADLSARSLLAIPRLAAACVRSFFIMRRKRPDVLLAMGSYASVGPVVAAWACRIPVVLHEANAVPGRAISFLARFATAIALTFPSAARRLGRHTHVVTGLPLRAALRPGARRPGDAGDVFHVLVMGGSQGAHRLNEIATEALCRLHGGGAPVKVIHLAGLQDESMVRERYAASGVPATVYGFLDNMALAYGHADFVVARAGAASCMELAVCALPALLVPLPSAVRDHQTANAKAMEEAGAADLLAQTELTAERLAAYLDACRRDPSKLARMSRQAKAVAITDAAERLADLLESSRREA